jgi:hypothetical protein
MEIKKIGEEQKPDNNNKQDFQPEKEIKKYDKPEIKSTNNKTYFILSGILLILIAVLLYYFLIYRQSENKADSEITVQTELKKKEIELKEKELQLKEKELQKSNNNPQNSLSSGNNNGLPGRFPEASLRQLTSDDLKYLSKYDLKIMRNEIYARYGYIFQTDDMRNYFNAQSWYSPRYNDVNSYLTKTEKTNIDLIKYFEK